MLSPFRPDSVAAAQRRAVSMKTRENKMRLKLVLALSLILPMGAFADDSNIDMNENLGSLRDVINRSANMDTETQAGDEDAAAASAPRGRATRLADMFSPPLHLIHSAGGFQGARNFAKDSKRWLLVNLQSDSEFACHALNRDVWRDELCENLVREGFIFWQTVSGHC